MYQVRRIIMAFCGVVLCGFCVGALQKANLGVDPFTCFVTGIANIFNSTYSTFYLILTGLLLALVFILRRHYIGVATVINLFFTGVAADGMHRVKGGLKWLFFGVLKLYDYGGLRVGGCQSI